MWGPWRYLPGAVDFGLAFAGHLSSVEREDPRFAEKFARQFYGLADGRAVGDALVRLHDNAVGTQLYDRAIGSRSLSREELRLLSAAAAGLAPAIGALKRERGKVTRNRPRYDDVLLSAQTVLLVVQRAPGGQRGVRAWSGSARRAQRADALYKRVVGAWNRDRHPADPYRFGDRGHDFLPHESILAVLRGLHRR